MSDGIERFLAELKSKALVQPLVGIVNRDINKEECHFIGVCPELDIVKKGTIVHVYKYQASNSVHDTKNAKISFFSGYDTNFCAEIPLKSVDWNYDKQEYCEVLEKYSLNTLDLVSYSLLYNRKFFDIPENLVILE
jgi:hypothetical protein